MNGIAEMIKVVQRCFTQKGVKIQGGFPMNQSRNFYFETDRGPFLLKWNVEEFHNAGRIRELGGKKGPGMTISLPLIESVRTSKPFLLFAINGSDIIWCKDYDEFMRMSCDYEQSGGEFVRVILTKDLDIWCELRLD